PTIGEAKYSQAHDDKWAGEFNHLKWKPRQDNSIELAAIRIPPADVVGKMVRVTGGKFEMGFEPFLTAPKHIREVADFYVDPREVNFKEYFEVFKRYP